jgi:hypothetical protein
LVVKNDLKMQPILDELEAAAEKMSVKVSYEVLTDTVGGGGLCKVKGAYRVIIDKRGTVGEKALTLARALAQVGVGEIFLSPAAREMTDRFPQQPGA